MRKTYILLIIAMLCLNSLGFAQQKHKNKELEEFVSDLSSSNTKLLGRLLLIGPYKGDLSYLTYDQYIKQLKANESASDKGLAELIQECDKHLFVARKNSFLIALYSKELQVVLYDIASSAFTDSIKQIETNEGIPDLHEFIKKTKFVTDSGK